jgi:hypothetical protein
MLSCKECQLPYVKSKKPISKDFGGGVELHLKKIIHFYLCQKCGDELISMKESQKENIIVLNQLLLKYHHLPMPGTVVRWIHYPSDRLAKELRLSLEDFHRLEKQTRPLDRISSEIVLLKVKQFLMER